MSSQTLKPIFQAITIAGIVIMGQSCAKDMTTQDYNNELAAENLAKVQAQEGTYRGNLKNASGQPVGALTIVVTAQTVNPGANNNTSQNVGFGGTLLIDTQGTQELRLGYSGAYYDFTAANYRFNTTITMPDGTATDTIEVGGQFNDGVMTGTLYAGKYPDAQYTTSFNLTRNGAMPSTAGLVTSQRSDLVSNLGVTADNFTGTSDLPGLGETPIQLTLTSNLTSDQAFYSFIAPVMEIDASLTLNPGNPFAEGLAFKSCTYDLVHSVITCRNSSSGTEELACTQSAGVWDCTENEYGKVFSFDLSPTN